MRASLFSRSRDSRQYDQQSSGISTTESPSSMTNEVLQSVIRRLTAVETKVANFSLTLPSVVVSDDSSEMSRMKKNILFLNSTVRKLEVNVKLSAKRKYTVKKCILCIMYYTKEVASFHVFPVPRTCTEMKRLGVKSSGLYEIDPDGSDIGESPISVFCNLDSANPVTEVLHDAEDMVDVESCQGESCFEHQIKYKDATLRQMKTLISLSEDCHQSIEVLVLCVLSTILHCNSTLHIYPFSLTACLLH